MKICINWSDVTVAPADAIFGVNQAYEEDESDVKVNLSYGVYRDDKSKAVVFDAVKEAAARIYAPESGYNKDYLPMGGSLKFLELARKLVFGNAMDMERIGSIQTPGGTGALSLIGCYLRTFAGAGETPTLYLSNPSWANHRKIYEECHKFEVLTYEYLTEDLRSFNFEGACKDLKKIPDGSLVVLHACAHNPSGIDPTKEQWKTIVEIVAAKQHFVILDFAYQGFASGCVENDAYAVRLFAEQENLRFVVCESFAKNMGLYGERLGALHYVGASPSEAKAVRSRLQAKARQMWSNPPRHGSDIAILVMSDKDLRQKWLAQLQQVAKRLQDMRREFAKLLPKYPRLTKAISSQNGMFGYTGLKKEDVLKLRSQFHIYMLDSGRISLAGLNTSNIKYVAEAIEKCVDSSEN